MTSSRYFKSKNHRKEISKTLKEYFQSPEGIKHRQKLSLLRKLAVGKKSNRWKGGRRLDGSGYVLIWKPEHPYSNNSGCVREHRLVMEKRIGRYLKPNEIVHHIDGNRQHNRDENLRLFNNHSEHSKIAFSGLSRKERFYLFFIIFLLNENRKLEESK